MKRFLFLLPALVIMGGSFAPAQEPQAVREAMRASQGHVFNQLDQSVSAAIEQSQALLFQRRRAARQALEQAMQELPQASGCVGQPVQQPAQASCSGAQQAPVTMSSCSGYSSASVSSVQFFANPVYRMPVARTPVRTFLFRGGRCANGMCR